MTPYEYRLILDCLLHIGLSSAMVLLVWAALTFLAWNVEDGERS